MQLWKRTRSTTHTASLFAKPSPLNINLSSDRFSMFNKERDIFQVEHANVDPDVRLFLLSQPGRYQRQSGMEACSKRGFPRVLDEERCRAAKSKLEESLKEAEPNQKVAWKL